MFEGLKSWGANIRINRDKTLHATVWDGDNNTRVSTDIDENGVVPGSTHHVDQNTGEHSSDGGWRGRGPFKREYSTEDEYQGAMQDNGYGYYEEP